MQSLIIGIHVSAYEEIKYQIEDEIQNCERIIAVDLSKAYNTEIEPISPLIIFESNQSETDMGSELSPNNSASKRTSVYKSTYHFNGLLNQSGLSYCKTFGIPIIKMPVFADTVNSFASQVLSKQQIKGIQQSRLICFREKENPSKTEDLLEERPWNYNEQTNGVQLPSAYKKELLNVINREIKNGIRNLGSQKIGSQDILPDNKRAWLSDENIEAIREQFFETTCQMFIGLNNFINYDDETG